ncbi:MAG: MFS transporter [Alphaproteobacteria bacterium]
MNLSGLANIKRVFAIRNYRIFVVGNLSSSLGNWIHRVAVGWLAWELTGSATWLGVMAFADLAPTVLIGPIAGAVVDRSHYLRVLKVTQTINMCQAGALAVLTFADAITIWLLLGLTLVRGINVAFNRPARMSLVYELVPRAELSSAIALNAVIFNSARFMGPAMGGVLISAGSVGLAFTVNMLSFLVFLVALMMLRMPTPEAREKSGRGLMGDAMEGIRYALAHPAIGMILAIMVLTALFVRPFSELLPAFADKVFGRGVEGLAWLISANGIGAMIAGLWLAARGQTAGLANIVVLGLLLMALALLGFTATDEFWLAWPFLILAGFAMVAQGVASQTLVQIGVASEMRGRVMGIYGIVARGGPAIGALFMGILSDQVGLRLPVAGGAALCLVLWLWATRRMDAITSAIEIDPPPTRL